MQAHYYAEYAVVEETHWWFRARRRILRAVLEEAGLWRADLRFGDVGVGTGRMLEFLAEGPRVLGIDRDAAALQFAARRTTTPLVQADATALPLAAASVDGLTAFDIIEHLPDETPALDEFFRVIRPGGHLVVTVPALQFLWSEHDEINQHQRRYDAAGLAACLTRAGFRITRTTYFNTLLLPPIAAIRSLRRLFGRAASRRDVSGRLRSDFSLLPSPIVGALCEQVFGLEAPLLRRFDFPIGVSLIAIARRP